MGGGANTAKNGNSKELRSSPSKRVPQLLGTNKKLPWHRRGTEVDREALAGETRTGAEDDDEEKTA